MKKKIAFTALTCVLGAALLCMVAAIGKSSNMFGVETLKKGKLGVQKGDRQYDYTWDQNEDPVTGLKINWINGDVKIETGGKLIKVSEFSDEELTEEENLAMEISGSVLEIDWEDSLISLPIAENSYKDLTVTLPEEIAESLESLECSITAGNFTCSGINAQDVKLSSASAQIDISSLKGNTGSFSSGSGNINLSDLSFAEEFSASSSFGKLRLDSLTTPKAGIKAVSGELRLSGSISELSVETISADAQLNLSGCPQKAELSSVSGNLAVFMPEPKGFDASFSTVSGKLSSDFALTGEEDDMRFGSGGGELELSTTFGNVSINRSE